MLLNKNLALFLILVSITIIGIVVWRSWPTSPARQNTRHLGNKLQEQGIETQSDYIRFKQIETQIKQTKSISDSDLEWMLALMKKPSTHPEIVVPDVLAVIDLLKIMTPSQKQSIFDAAVPLLTSNSSTDTYHFIPQTAANVLGHLGDAKAIPYLQPLLNNPDPDVRERARHALDKLH